MKIRTAELDAHQEQLRLETEKVRLEQERLRLQIENAENPAAQIKKYGDALRGAIGRIPTDPADLPSFFDNAERLFDEIKAPRAYRAQLLMPYLSDKARIHLLVAWSKLKHLIMLKSKNYFYANSNSHRGLFEEISSCNKNSR